MGRRLFQNRTRTDGTRRRGLLVARLAAVERVEIHPRTVEHLLAQPHLLQPCGASEPRTAPLHLPPLGRAGQPPLSAGIFGRHLRHMAHARLPALLHGYGFERQLRLVGPRHRRPHVPQDTEGDRPGTLHALAAIRRIHSDLQNPFDQRPAHRTLHLVLSRPYVPHARRHPPALHAGTLYL